MRQIAATRRQLDRSERAATCRPRRSRWGRVGASLAAAATMCLLAGGALLAPTTWLRLLDAVEATVFGSVWLLARLAAVLVESLALLAGVVRIGEALEPVVTTPAAAAATLFATLLCLTVVYLFHRFSAGAERRRPPAAARAGALLLVGGICVTGAAFGQPQTAAEEVQEEASGALDEVREQLDAVGEETQSTIEDTLERLDDIERNLSDRGGDDLVDLDNKVSFGSTVRVGRGEVTYDIVAIGGGVKVDGEVRGDAVSIGGGAKIDGRVTGEVVAIGGDVELGPEAEVLGDIVSVGGRVEREDGSTVIGEISEVDWAGLDWDWNWDEGWGDGWRRGWFPGSGERPPFFRLGRMFDFVQSIALTGLLIVMAGLVLLVLPAVVDRVGTAVTRYPALMFAVGVGIEIFFIPALIIAVLLLTITLIGIPVAILLVLVAFPALAIFFVVGYAGAASAAGAWCRGRFPALRNVTDSAFATLALGVLTIQALALGADLLGFLGLPWVFRIMFAVPGFVICFVAWAMGLGAVVMTRFGAADYEGGVAALTLPAAPSESGAAGASSPGEPGGGDAGDTAAEPPEPPKA